MIAIQITKMSVNLLSSSKIISSNVIKFIKIEIKVHKVIQEYAYRRHVHSVNHSVSYRRILIIAVCVFKESFALFIEFFIQTFSSL